MFVSVRGWKGARGETAISARCRSSAVVKAADLKSRVKVTPLRASRSGPDTRTRSPVAGIRKRCESVRRSAVM
jgi:hypothetical protein